jgi:cytochrome c5
VAAIIAAHFNALKPENSMSDNHHAPADAANHAGSGKNRRQLWLTVFFSFALPLLAIVAIVRDVTSAGQPTGSAVFTETAVTGRIEKIGKIEFGSASHAPKTGEEVFKAQCTTCHSAGLLGAPKFGDAGAWAPRIKTGYEALLNSALKGKNAMTPQAGGAFDTLEIGRAVVYMANAGGAKFEEPQAPAVAAPAAAASAVK